MKPSTLTVVFIQKGGTDMDVHEKLQHLLDEQGWTRYQLAKRCGLSESTIANIFRRNTIPSIGTLEAICNAFGITLSQFFAEGMMIELTPEVEELVSSWITLTSDQKSAAMQMLRAMNRK